MSKDVKKILKICGCVFLLYLAMTYWEVAAGFLKGVFHASFPLILGAGIAYIVNIPMSFYERHYFPEKQTGFAAKSRKVVCLTGAFATIIAIISLVVSLILPQLILCIKMVVDFIPDFVSDMIDWDKAAQIIPDNLTEFLTSVDWENRIGQITKLLSSGMVNFMDGVVTTVTSVFSGVVNMVVGIVFAVYLLAGKNRIASQLSRVSEHYIKDSVLRKIRYCAEVFNVSFHRFIVGQCTEAVILGVLCMLGMFILRIPYATMIGALVAFTALIPIVGAFIGAGVGAFMILTVSPVKALIFLIFLIILQQIEENLIYPRVVGSSIGLPGIWVLAAITIGGGIMGISGMLIGVPLTAAVYRIIRDDMRKNHTPEVKEIEQTDSEDTEQG